MTRWTRALAFMGLLLFAAPVLQSGATDQTQRKLQAPILVTSSGQALDGFTVKTLMGRAGLNAAYEPKATASMLGDAKTVIIAVGVSNKGFGQAGITAETELTRTKEILQVAKEKGITVACVHIGGAERRKGLSVQFVELVAPAADLLIVAKDGNQDDYFGEVAKKTGAPLIVIERALDIGKTVATLLAQG